MATSGINSPVPTTAEVVGGVNNLTPPALADGQAAALQLDAAGRLKANVTASGAPPALNNPLPVELSDGTNALGVPGNPINDNLVQWAGGALSAATNAAGDGTQIAPTIRSIQRKFLALNITALPATNATTYYGPGGASTNPAVAGWFDTQQTGGNFVTLVENSSTVSGWNTVLNGIQIQGTNDTTDASLTAMLKGSGYDVLNQFTIYNTYVGTRYWRVTATTPVASLGFSSFHLTVEESTIVPPPPVAVGGGEILTGVAVPGDGFVGSQFGWVADIYRDATGGDRQAVRLFTPALSYGGNYGPVAIQRTPVIFKTAQATVAGNTALWTPTAGKKFRLMRFMIQITGQSTMAVAGTLTVSFQDGTTVTNIAVDSYIPASVAAPASEDFVSPWVDLDNGYLSGVANNVLNINLSAALTAGNVRVFCCGTEEQ